MNKSLIASNKSANKCIDITGNSNTETFELSRAHGFGKN